MKPALLATLLLVAACGGETAPPPPDLASTDGAANREWVDSALASGLERVPEVMARGREFRDMSRRGWMTAEEAAKEYRIWIQRWEASNPDLAAAARAQDAGPDGGDDSRD